MSKAKDEYNNIVRPYNEIPEVLICDDYIKELEQQKAELLGALQKCLLSADHYDLQECLAVLNKYKDGE